jgi:hypothetical protein
MVRTEVKISMKKKYSACLYFILLKSYPNKYIYNSKTNKQTNKKKGRRRSREQLLNGNMTFYSQLMKMCKGAGGTI